MARRFALSTIAAIALTLAPVGAFTALADDGSTAPPATAVPSFRPPSGALRHVAAPLASAPTAPAATVPAATAAVLPAPAAAPGSTNHELVVLVGGYQSCSCPSDTTFDTLSDPLRRAGYEVLRFGQDPRFPYDTYGAIDTNAQHLRDEIRAVSPDYRAVHIVTHSMGGVVADRAFAQGLSADDGVATYVSLSAPHSGSDAARAVSVVNAVGPRELLRRVSSLGEFETQSDAAADLASARPVPPPAGVVRLDLRSSSDLLVTGRDARDPGVPSRLLTTEGLDGHGAILNDPTAIDLMLRTITTRRVPPEERPQQRIAAAQRDSDGRERIAGAFLAVLAAILIVGCLTPVGGSVRTIEDIFALCLPKARRRGCA